METNYIVYANVFLPDEEAPYYFQQYSDEVKPSTVLDFFYRWYRYAFTTKIELPTFTHPISAPVKKNAAFTPRPRTNNLGLVLTNRNTLLYVPNDANELEAFVS